MVRSATLLLLAARGLAAQQAEPGIAPSWDTPKLFQEIMAQSNRLQPLLRQIKPADWLRAGAPKSYVDLLTSVQTANQALPGMAQTVSQTPDRVADSLLSSII